jgi:antitoxin (DNA-binding transcriptional repressor) of toxin-antitoxin stability system
MQQVTIHAAKTNLSKHIEAALSGEEVVNAKGSTPVVRLVPVARGAFQIGLLRGQLCAGPDFFEGQDEADLQLWEGGAD